MKDMYDFYHEISIKKVLLWGIYTFLWIIMIIYFLSGTRAGFFDAVVDRTNIVVFYCFWIIVYVSVYIYLYIQVFKKNREILKCCVLCFISFFMVNIIFFGTLKVAIFSFREFSIESWMEYKNERKYMLDDLVRNTDIIGMSVSDAETLLGKPDSYYGNPVYTKSNGLVYWSGGYNIVFWIENDKIVGHSMW